MPGRGLAEPVDYSSGGEWHPRLACRRVAGNISSMYLALLDVALDILQDRFCILWEVLLLEITNAYDVSEHQMRPWVLVIAPEIVRAFSSVEKVPASRPSLSVGVGVSSSAGSARKLSCWPTARTRKRLSSRFASPASPGLCGLAPYLTQNRQLASVRKA